MLKKFETKSNRVKGVAFHPKRPWILASLHNGVVQLWDYRSKTLVDKFEEHEGPVRGVSFHMTQPLFVSGGDDYKIKVWNYKQRKCLFTLNGHMDYIRTVFFHHEYPWIISASDDQTIRIWNWQSRNCISILTGHNHYVMCAQFHPKDPLVVSSSLDQTVRVWDISGLKAKNIKPAKVKSTFEEFPGSGQPELFGSTDAIVKYVLEGHDRGVNWATFHPTLPLIVSGSDDRQVKLWRMSDTKAWEVDTLRGHHNNVSCVLFHPKGDLIISNSEDKKIRVWDTAKRTAVSVFKLEHDRFWVLAAHPELNLFAAGHDSGMIVFKLERERPAYWLEESKLYFVKDKFLRMYDVESSHDIAVAAVKKPAGLNANYRQMSFNAIEKNVILSTNDGVVDVVYLPDVQSEGSSAVDVRTLQGKGGVFVGRNRFAILDTETQVSVHSARNEQPKVSTLPFPVTYIYSAGTNRLILIGAQNVALYDVQQQAVVEEVQLARTKYCYWSSDLSQVALVGKNSIYILNKKLVVKCSVQEMEAIKSGFFEENGVFIYSTSTHLKYCLPQGDNGIIKSVEQPMYAVAGKGKLIYCLDRDGKVRAVTYDATEYLFKLALIRKQYNQVLAIMRTSNLVGQSIISYFRKKGYPEVALLFVKDPRTRFDLAVECGNLPVALDAAKQINKEQVWTRLAEEALKQGNHSVVELAYQNTKNFDGLSFLYLLTGNIEKLKKMMAIAEARNDSMALYNNALFLGDIPAQLKILQSSGQNALAFALAATRGFKPETEKSIAMNAGVLLAPPIPLFPQTDVIWPVSSATRNIFDDSTEVVEEERKEIQRQPQQQQQQQKLQQDPAMEELEVEVAGWDIEDTEIEVEDEVLLETTSKYAYPTTRAQPLSSSKCPLIHIEQGSFEMAFTLLQHQLGISNFAPLKPFFLKIACSSKLYVHGFFDNVVSLPLSQRVTFSFDELQQLMAEGFRLTTQGNFSEAIARFRQVLWQRIVTDACPPEVDAILVTCRDYIQGLSMELERKSLPDLMSKKALELSAYFTLMHLLPQHLILSLQSAMVLSFKAKNFVIAGYFSRRLLESATNQEQARKVLAVCEKNPSNAIAIDFDSMKTSVICSASFASIQSDLIECSYCQSPAATSFRESTCKVCEIGTYGRKGTGLVSK